MFSQIVNTDYIGKKLDEAKTYYDASESQKAYTTLDELISNSQKEKNNFGYGMGLIKKVFYDIELGYDKNVAKEWAVIENLKISNPNHEKEIKMGLLWTKSLYFKNKEGGLSKSTEYLNEALRIAGKPPIKSSITAEIYYTLGSVKEKNNEYASALDYYQKSVQMYEKENEPESAGLVYVNISNVYFYMGEIAQSIQYSHKAIQSRKRAKDYENLCVQLSNLARIYNKINQMDSAIYYYKESNRFAQNSKKPETKFISLVDLAMAYHAQKDRPNALKYMEEAIEYGKEINRHQLYRYTRVAGMFAGYTGDEEKMNRYYEESYQKALEAKDNGAVRDWYGSLNFYYKNVKNDPATAYGYLENFHAYKDSILNETSKKNFHELEVKYETEKKEAEIERLAIDSKIKNLEIEKKNALIRGNLIEAEQKQREIEILVKTKEINDLKISQQNEFLKMNQAQIHSLEQQKKIAYQENELKERKIQNQNLTRNLGIASFLIVLISIAFLVNRILLKKKIEQKNLIIKERNRISSELHDEVGSTLTAINLISHSAIKDLNLEESKTKVQIEKIKENTQNVMENISDIVWSMNPDNDNFRQIIVRMKEFTVNILENNKIDYQFEIDDSLNEVKFSPEKRRDFYLIFKEALNNLSKYSQADFAKISIMKNPHEIHMKIKDNGVGFDLSTVKLGNGLKNMKMRTENQKGKFEISSNKSGTQIYVSFPYA
ncbi:tetratricopeptide repeat-containing sensor histidine kinase [Moheibacter sediminis]|nr:tetratricopeptide repeat-containing sensor histidine kinase [Moheibacter sediminis]